MLLIITQPMINKIKKMSESQSETKQAMTCSPSKISHFQLFDVSFLENQEKKPHKYPRNSFYAQKFRKSQGSYLYPVDHENNKQLHKSLSYRKQCANTSIGAINPFFVTTRPNSRHLSSSRATNQFPISKDKQKDEEEAYQKAIPSRSSMNEGADKKYQNKGNKTECSQFSYEVQQCFSTMKLVNYKRMDQKRSKNGGNRRESRSENKFQQEKTIFLKYENNFNIRGLKPTIENVSESRNKKSLEAKDIIIKAAQMERTSTEELVPVIELSNRAFIKYRSSFQQKQSTKFVWKTPNIKASLSQKSQKFSSPTKKTAVIIDYFGKPKQNSSAEQLARLKALYYRDIIWKIWFNSGWKVQIESYCSQGFEPPKFFIGKGNNSKLVKRIMAQRWWWKIETKQENSNFLWTQLKVYSAYQSQVEYKRVQAFEMGNEKLEICPLQIDPFQKTPVKSQAEQQSLEQEQEGKVENINSQRQQKVVVERKFMVKTHSQLIKKKSKEPSKGELQSKMAKLQVLDKNKRILTDSKYQRWKDHVQCLANLKKEQKSSENLESRRLLQKQINMTIQKKFPEKVTNHLQYSRLIGNKKALYKTMSLYYELAGKPSLFLPMTFHITSGLEDKLYLKFLNEYYKKAKEENNTMWIVKPGEMSNRGCGIQVCKDIQDVKKIIKNKKSHANGKSFSYIIQEYLREPFLYQNRKFDIRHYMMINSSFGRIKGYWYEDGYIRTTSYKYSTKNNDPSVHLTNDAVQKYCKDYGKYEKGNKVSYQEFEKYLQTLPDWKQKGYNFHDKILPKIREISIQIMNACYYTIDSKRKGNNFQIFGLDIMIDSDFRPWLIEVNTNPCLELSSPVLAKIIPKMLDNAFTISLDPLFPPPSDLQIAGKKNNLPQNYILANKFELVFDEIIDGENLNKVYDKVKNQLAQMDGFGSDEEAYESAEDDCDTQY